MNIDTLNTFTENYTLSADEVPASVDVWKLEENQAYEFIADEHKILFVLSGSFICSLRLYR